MEGGGSGQEAGEGSVYAYIQRSCCCTTETNATLQSNYSPVKNKLKEEKVDEGKTIPGVNSYYKLQHPLGIVPHSSL